jgi:hypothetical protein
MKNAKIYLIAALIALTSLTFQSCKKGEDDPVVSLKTRKDRFTNTWMLTKYEKNGANQDLSGATYTYDVFNSGTLTQTIEGAVFGFPTKTVNDGSWEFINDEEDVRITIEGNATVYNVQRLASNELWLKRTSGGDVHMYYFEDKQ